MQSASDRGGTPEFDDILIVDDHKGILHLVSEILTDNDFTTRTATNGEECFKAVNDYPPSLVILDLWLQQEEFDGLAIMKELKANNPDIPIIIISAHGSVDVAVLAMRQGAYDFLEKPIQADVLVSVVKRAMEAAYLRRENNALRLRAGAEGDIVGSSSATQKMIKLLDRASGTNARVLLNGPTGSGKTLAAKYVHANSFRSLDPFIEVIPGAMSPERLAETLFGVPGDEETRISGLLEQAHRGTIFFDEVGDLPKDIQPKLLNAIVRRQFSRVGGTRMVRVSFRVISSTTRNLEKEVEEGRFLKDLYDRLNVMQIDVPGLDARRSDIPELAEHFIGQFHRSQGLAKRPLSDDAKKYLEASDWPRNVRQLRNAVERALILGKPDGPILKSEFETASERISKADVKPIAGHLMSSTLRDAREQFERDYLITQINRFGGNISRAAKHIGMERSALHRKLRALGVVTAERGGTRRVEYQSAAEEPGDEAEAG